MIFFGREKKRRRVKESKATSSTRFAVASQYRRRRCCCCCCCCCRCSVGIKNKIWQHFFRDNYVVITDFVTQRVGLQWVFILTTVYTRVWVDKFWTRFDQYFSIQLICRSQRETNKKKCFRSFKTDLKCLKITILKKNFANFFQPDL
jgi:hypothetical protein